MFYKKDNFTLIYKIEKHGTDEASITDGADCYGEVIVPEVLGYSDFTDEDNSDLELEEKTVRVKGIAKKAFFGSHASDIKLPCSLTKIDNWAFAGCKQLESIVLPEKLEFIGKELFLKSDNLSKVYIGDATEAMANLLASVIVSNNDYSMLAFSTKDPKKWFEAWDEKCINFIKEDDEKGFSPMLAGGEEDYITNENDVRYYCHLKRLKKMRIIFDRLIHGDMIDEKSLDFYKNYLMLHNFGAKDAEVWKFVLSSGKNQIKIYDAFLKSGCVTSENIEAMIAAVDEKNTELKAMLMRYKSENLSKEDFFDSLIF